MTRADGRRPDHLRPTTFDVEFVENPAGHALIRAGKTMVLCTASVQESVPRWLYGKGLGWLTARSNFSGGVNVCFGDGGVRFIRNGIDLTTWRGMATRAGGEVLGNY